MTSLVTVRRRVAIGLALGVALAALAMVSPSQATFRGKNGRLVFQAPVGAKEQLFTVNLDGTGGKQITRFKDSWGTNAHWTKDGSRIVFTRNVNATAPTEKLILYTVNADGTGMRAIPEGGDLSVSPNWLRDGHRIVFLDVRSGKLMLINDDGTRLRSAGISGIGGDSVCVFPDGRNVAFLRGKPGKDSATAIFVAGLFGHGLKRITPWGSHADGIDCSPDGKRIVFSQPAFSGESGRSSNVFTVKTDGTGLVQLTHESDSRTNAGADSWSPDGTKIAYLSNKSGTLQVWTMNVDGTGQKQLTHLAGSHLAAWGSHP